jgi:phosphoribosylformylglycinamidine synthase subunit PurS
MKATVFVRPKHGILDPQGQAVTDSLQQLGFSVTEARIGRVIDLDLGDFDREQARTQVERMCEQLLANPLIESFDIELSKDDG